MQKTEVLIVGAGPTGLVHALWLTKAGVKVRIIDKLDKQATTTRATIFHARNLEFYRQMGIDDLALKGGVAINAVTMWAGGKKRGHVSFGNLKTAISRYQYVLGFPQDAQETMLTQQLALLGVNIEWSTTFISFQQSATGVVAQLSKTTGPETCEVQYLVSCEGAHSVVRAQIGAEFPGGTYEEMFYVADIKCEGEFDQGEINIALDESDFLAIFPSKNATRLVGSIRQEAMNKKDLKWEDVSEGVITHLKMKVLEVKWFSTYKVHHRVASRFRNGRVFLMGDAAHIHSPVGGQGMNTGIGDAVNLAWKIKAVIKDNAPLSLLDTFEPERVAFAQLLVATTDTVFTFVSARGFLAKQIRLHVAPRLFSFLSGFVAVRRLLFRTVSQTAIKYPQSALSVGAAGQVKGGDRLPWVTLSASADNYEPLKTMQWQAHIYGNSTADISKFFEERDIRLQVFPFTETAKEAGLEQHAVYILRPDGYVGLAEPHADINKIKGYLAKWNIGKG